jgi:hypothetical protein
VISVGRVVERALLVDDVNAGLLSADDNLFDILRRLAHLL